MKKLILYLTIFSLVVTQNFATEGLKQERIVIKLLTVETNTSVSKLSRVNSKISIKNSLEDIANSLNSKVSSLFGRIPSLPSPHVDVNNSLEIAINELRKYKTIVLDNNLTNEEILQAIHDIEQLDNIDIVYAKPKPVLAEINAFSPDTIALPSANSTGNYISYQGYLNPAPHGIDAKYAWNINGGNGEGVKVVDVEYAWQETHEDFPNFFTQIGGTYNSSYRARNHGTATLGVIGAVDNGFGMKGIASDAQIGTSTIIFEELSKSIKNAADAVGPGGVIIIELEGCGPDTGSCPDYAGSCRLGKGDCYYVPIEYWQSEYDAIRYATALGVTVVEPGGQWVFKSSRKPLIHLNSR